MDRCPVAEHVYMQRELSPFSPFCFCSSWPPARRQRNRERNRDRDQDRGPRETENVDRTLSLQPGGTVRLKTFSGRVNITGSSGNQVVIKAVRRATRERLDDIKLEITQSGNVIDIDANHRVVERRNDNVVETDFDIQVPSQVKLDLRTFSAPITVTGVSGDLGRRRLLERDHADRCFRTEAGQDLQRRRQRRRRGTGPTATT